MPAESQIATISHDIHPRMTLDPTHSEPEPTQPGDSPHGGARATWAFKAGAVGRLHIGTLEWLQMSYVDVEASGI